MTGAIVVPLRGSKGLQGVTIHGLIPLRVLKYKLTSFRGMVVPFRVLSRKMRGSKCQSTVFKCIVLELVPLRGKNCSDNAHKTEIWYLLGDLFKISNDHPITFIWSSLPPPYVLSCYENINVYDLTPPCCPSKENKSE